MAIASGLRMPDTTDRARARFRKERPGDEEGIHRHVMTERDEFSLGTVCPQLGMLLLKPLVL